MGKQEGKWVIDELISLEEWLGWYLGVCMVGQVFGMCVWVDEWMDGCLSEGVGQFELMQVGVWVYVGGLG